MSLEFPCPIGAHLLVTRRASRSAAEKCGDARGSRPGKFTPTAFSANGKRLDLHNRPKAVLMTSSRAQGDRCWSLPWGRPRAGSAGFPRAQGIEGQKFGVLSWKLAGARRKRTSTFPDEDIAPETGPPLCFKRLEGFVHGNRGPSEPTATRRAESCGKNLALRTVIYGNSECRQNPKGACF